MVLFMARHQLFSSIPGAQTALIATPSAERARITEHRDQENRVENRKGASAPFLWIGKEHCLAVATTELRRDLRRADSAKNLIGAREMTIVQPHLDFDPGARAIYYARVLVCAQKSGDEFDAS